MRKIPRAVAVSTILKMAFCSLVVWRSPATRFSSLCGDLNELRDRLSYKTSALLQRPFGFFSTTASSLYMLLQISLETVSVLTVLLYRFLSLL